MRKSLNGLATCLLAIPLVIARLTAISASNGILIRNRIAFEKAKDIQAVVFDKTGTLTKGELSVDQVVVLDNKFIPDKIAYIATTLEQYSEHSIAKGIIEYAKKNNVDKAVELSRRTYKKRRLNRIYMGNRIQRIRYASCCQSTLLYRIPITTSSRSIVHVAEYGDCSNKC